jgi:NADH dehydrogenase FAD-containing subunit
MNIVIIGGFAGINLATELLNQKVSKLLLLIKTTIIFSAAYFQLLSLVIVTLLVKPSAWVLESYCCAFRKHTS